MRTIGLIGGMSWESTAVYYREANELVRERLGGLSSAEIVLSSVDFAEIGRLQREGKWHEAGAILAGRARILERAGAGMILICTNTMHLLFDTVQAAVSIPVLHIGDVVADAVRAAGLRSVGLLGTAFTMEKPFYRDRITSHGFDVIVPEPGDRAYVHRAIFGELTVGVIDEETRAEICGVIARMADRGAEGVILGCTELELLIGDDDAAVPLFPTARLHISAAVEWALGSAGSEGPRQAQSAV